MKTLNTLILLVLLTFSNLLLADTKTVLKVTEAILKIEKSQLAMWWRYMTPVEKRDFIRRLKQGNRIKTYTREEFEEVEKERLLEWIEYRIKKDGGL